MAALENTPAVSPGTDQALQARVDGFYQACIEGKYRAADHFVAEESKDAFYAMNKKHYLSCAGAKAEYSENFTRAKVTIDCEVELTSPGAPNVKVKMQQIGLWKLMDGQWYWYIDQKAAKMTPFGDMSVAPSSGSQPQSVLPGKPIEAKDLAGGVKADKTVVHLSKVSPAEQQVTISNFLPGPVSLSLIPPSIPGLDAHLDHSDLARGSKATLDIRYTPPKAAGPIPNRSAVSIMVQPLGREISIRVIFDAADEHGAVHP